MGVALVTKCVIEKRLRQGCICYLLHCRRHFNSCTLATRWSASILKVGMAPVYQAFKRRVGCSYGVIILCQKELYH